MNDDVSHTKDVPCPTCGGALAAGAWGCPACETGRGECNCVGDPGMRRNYGELRRRIAAALAEHK